MSSKNCQFDLNELIVLLSKTLSVKITKIFFYICANYLCQKNKLF